MPTKFVLISDTHGLHLDLHMPSGDILLVAGDITMKGSLQELARFDAWLAGLDYRHKIVVAGNHDFCFESSFYQAKSMLRHATYLQDEEIALDGFRIYGSPWQPRFFDWAFNLDRGEALRKVWAKIPDETDILITHGPPYGIGDIVPSGDCVGCQELTNRIRQLHLKLHVFGHIHEGYGDRRGDPRSVNASVCTGKYIPINPPVVVTLP